MSNTKYYLALSVCCLAIVIYNLSLFIEGNTMICYESTRMNNATYQEYLKTLGNSTVENQSYSNGFYQVNVLTSNIYPMLCIVISIAYVLIMNLSLYLALVINYMSNQLPEDFLNIGKWKKYFSCFCKIFPIFIILCHWLVLLLITAIWLLVISKKCSYSKSSTQIGITTGMYFQNIVVLNLVNTFVWILLHYGGAILKEVIYQDPFMYNPYVGSSQVFNVLKKLGP